MGPLLQLLVSLCGLGTLVCYILVLIQMFQRGKTGLGIACIVLCCIGILITFIYGWIKAEEWGIKKLMLIWTGIIVVHLLIGVAGGIMGVWTAQAIHGGFIHG